MKSQKVAFFGILGALSLTLSFFEGVMLPEIPFLPPGAKLGLSNIAVMYAGSVSGFAGAVYIVLIKAVFALLTRGVTGGLMSLCGGLLSCMFAMLMLKKEGKTFSFIGIGIVSAVMHNLGQLVAACFVTGTASLLNYGKYLLIFALITGAVTGTALYVLMPGLKKISGFYINDKTKELENL